MNLWFWSLSRFGYIFWLSDKHLYIKLMLLLLLYSEIFRKFLQRWIGFVTISTKTSTNSLTYFSDGWYHHQMPKYLSSFAPCTTLVFNMLVVSIDCPPGWVFFPVLHHSFLNCRSWPGIQSHSWLWGWQKSNNESNSLY